MKKLGEQMGRNLSNQGTGIGLYRDKAFRP